MKLRSSRSRCASFRFFFSTSAALGLRGAGFGASSSTSRCTRRRRFVLPTGVDARSDSEVEGMPGRAAPSQIERRHSAIALAKNLPRCSRDGGVMAQQRRWLKSRCAPRGSSRSGMALVASSSTGQSVGSSESQSCSTRACAVGMSSLPHHSSRRGK